jgi:hypothetical protein
MSEKKKKKKKRMSTRKEHTIPSTGFTGWQSCDSKVSGSWPVPTIVPATQVKMKSLGNWSEGEAVLFLLSSKGEEIFRPFFEPEDSASC